MDILGGGGGAARRGVFWLMGNKGFRSGELGSGILEPMLDGWSNGLPRSGSRMLLLKAFGLRDAKGASFSWFCPTAMSAFGGGTL